jgi:hypothetical protein
MAAIMWRPKLIIRVLCTWVILARTSWLVKSCKIDRYQNIIASVDLDGIMMLNLITDIRIRILSSIVIASINDELLRCTLGLDDNVFDENWYINYL